MATARSAASLRAELHELDEAIMQLNRKLFQASAARKKSRRSVVRCHLRITSEIFTEAANGLEIDVRLGIPTAVALASVCTTWRSIALSLPSLWSNLKIALREIAHSSEPHEVLDFISLCIERSRRQPLDIEICQCQWEVEKSLELPAILRLVAPHSPRWTRFSFGSHGALASFQELKGRLSNLRTLELKVAEVRTSAFEDAPALRELRLAGTPAKHLALPWTQLEILRLHQMGVENSIEVLQRSRNVQELSLCFDARDSVMQSPRVTVELPHPRSLNMLYYNDKRSPLTKQLSLPALAELSVTFPDVPRQHVPSEAVDSVQAFLRTESTVLNEIVMQDRDLTAGADDRLHGSEGYCVSPLEWAVELIAKECPVLAGRVMEVKTDAGGKPQQ
ncbi:F-box domain-containing protein [Mycena kentingensis (nom. inval.)]|nr:F-box domain-containing protein [Mycena kentingensis (nom. inval.)]